MKSLKFSFLPLFLLALADSLYTFIFSAMYFVLPFNCSCGGPFVAKSCERQTGPIPTEVKLSILPHGVEILQDVDPPYVADTDLCKQCT